MSFEAAADQIIDVIRALVPWVASATLFTCDGDGTGDAETLEAQAGDAHRLFDLRLRAGPVDDGEAGAAPARFKTGLDLRVLYMASDDRATLERIIASDVAQLSRTLMSPNTHHSSVVSVPPPGPATIEEISEDGMVVGYISRIPFDLIHLIAA